MTDISMFDLPVFVSRVWNSGSAVLRWGMVTAVLAGLGSCARSGHESMPVDESTGAGRPWPTFDSLPEVDIEFEAAEYWGGRPPMVVLTVVAQHGGREVQNADIEICAVDSDFPWFEADAWLKRRTFRVPLGARFGICVFTETHGCVECVARAQPPDSFGGDPVTGRVVIELGDPVPAGTLRVDVAPAAELRSRDGIHVGLPTGVSVTSPVLGATLQREYFRGFDAVTEFRLPHGRYGVEARKVPWRTCGIDPIYAEDLTRSSREVDIGSEGVHPVSLELQSGQLVGLLLQPAVGDGTGPGSGGELEPAAPERGPNSSWDRAIVRIRPAGSPATKLQPLQFFDSIIGGDDEVHRSVRVGAWSTSYERLPPGEYEVRVEGPAIDTSVHVIEVDALERGRFQPQKFTLPVETRRGEDEAEEPPR